MFALLLSFKNIVQKLTSSKSIVVLTRGLACVAGGMSRSSTSLLVAKNNRWRTRKKYGGSAAKCSLLASPASYTDYARIRMEPSFLLPINPRDEIDAVVKKLILALCYK